MTSVFSAEGKNIPCTVIEAGPCVVTQIKTVEKDGYEAVQIAYDDKSEKHTSKSLSGHFAKAGTTPKRKVAEFRDELRSGILKEIPHVILSSPKEGCLPNILNVSFEAIEGEALQLMLDEVGDRKSVV